MNSISVGRRSLQVEPHRRVVVAAPLEVLDAAVEGVLAVVVADQAGHREALAQQNARHAPGVLEAHRLGHGQAVRRAQRVERGVEDRS